MIGTAQRSIISTHRNHDFLGNSPFELSEKNHLDEEIQSKSEPEFRLISLNPVTHFKLVPPQQKSNPKFPSHEKRQRIE